MESVFACILNMSITGSVAILCVMLARLVMKRWPKIFSYALWSVVLFRLLCPVSMPSPVSLFRWFAPADGAQVQIRYFSIEDAVRPDTLPQFQSQPLRQEQREDIPTEPEESSPVLQIAAWVWCAGVLTMAGYSLVSYIRLRKRLVGAAEVGRRIYLADQINSPFVLGIFVPRVYLPSSVPVEERRYVLAHERHHIRRGDHLIKLMAYGALCLHWFNPLVWAAFLLAGKDMEMSCDEAVIKKLGEHVRKGYCQTLLRLSTRRTVIAGTPLAFGEGDTKGRIMNMAKWKKPKIWVSLLCAVLCATVLIACGVNPEEPTQYQSERTYGPASVGLGEFNFTLPEGYSIQLEENQDGVTAYPYSITIYSGDKIAGGLALRYQQEGMTPGDGWEKQLGVPEALDESLGYMGGSSLYADWEMTYWPDVPTHVENGQLVMDENGQLVAEKEVTHYYFIDGTDVYDLWLITYYVSDSVKTEILESVDSPRYGLKIEPTEGEGIMTTISLEEEWLARCRSMLDAVQSSEGYQIVTDRENTSGALNPTSRRSDWKCKDSWLQINEIPEQGWTAKFAYLYHIGTYFDNESPEGGQDSDGNILWRESTDQGNIRPWLDTFQWEDGKVAFLSVDNKDACFRVYLAVNDNLTYGDNSTHQYMVQFVFDQEGAFLEAVLEADLWKDGSIAMQIVETMRVVSLDSDDAAEVIEAEYNRAVQ